jgi:hypothetical protein
VLERAKQPGCRCLRKCALNGMCRRRRAACGVRRAACGRRVGQGGGWWAAAGRRWAVCYWHRAACVTWRNGQLDSLASTWKNELPHASN